MPLDDRTALEQVLAERPRGGPDRQQYTYYPDVADVPESAAVAINGRSYTIAAGVTIDSADAEGVLFAHGGVAGGHSLYVKDKKLRYTFNWLGTKMFDVVADTDMTSGHARPHRGVRVEGPEHRSDDARLRREACRSTSTTQKVGEGEIVTQPGNFCLVGDGLCVGRDSASPVTPEYTAPYRFTGGTIDKVVVDVSGERFVDHEAQVAAWFAID